MYKGSVVTARDRAVYRLLAEHFGDDGAALKFMAAMAGIVLHFPRLESVELLAREKQIVVALTRDPQSSTVRRLSQLHSTSMRSVAKAYTRLTGRGLKIERRARAERERKNAAEIAGL